MPTFHSLDNSRPQFKNQFWTNKREKFVFSSRVSTHDIDNISLNKSFFLCWLKAINKVPQRKDWPNPDQKEISVEELLKKFGEYGVRTGTRLGNKYFEGVDIDIGEKVASSLQKRFETNFEFLAKIHHISYVRTKRGYHVYCLFEKLTPNENIYHVDKYGNRRNVGSILSKGRQIQGVGSKDKKWVDNGKWFWHLRDREELKENLARFFFLLDDNSEGSAKEASKHVNLNVKQHSKSKEIKEISNKIPYKVLKLNDILITSKQATKRVNHHRVNYLDKWQNKGFFFMDAYFRDKKEIIQPNLVGDFLLMKGYKYQFFAGFA